MAFTLEQLQAGLERARAAGDDGAVADLQARIAAADDGTAWMADYDPSRDVGTGEALLIGAGRTIDKISTGVTDLFDDAGGKAATARDQLGKDEAYSKLQERRPYSTTAGEIAPYLATIPLTGGVGTQMAIGGTLGAARYQEEAGDRAVQGGVDAAISALPYATGKAFQRMRGTNTRLAGRADDLGFPLTHGDRTNSSFLRGMEASMASNPFTAGPLRSLGDARQEVMNQASLRAIGETGENLADDSLIAARARIGAEFDEVISGNSFAIDDQFLSNLADVENAARQGLLGGGETDVIVNRLLEQAAKADGNVSGDTLQGWRTTLQTAADKAYRSDTVSREYAVALDSLVDNIDDLVGRTLPVQDLARWQTAREQWRAVKQLEQSRAINEAGDVSGRKLGANLARSDVEGYYRGGNTSDLYDAARLSRQHAPIADSGTATRMSIPMMTAAGVGSLGVYPLMNVAARGYTNPDLTGRLTSATLRSMSAKSHEEWREEMRRRVEALKNG